jgi:uncharacterized protein YndB with AHSA1/START domain
MKTQTYEITINASKSKVWGVLWTDETYRKWTSAFSEVSTAQSDWNEGSRVLFGDGKGNGMYSVIEKKDAPHTMIFRHLGEICDGVEMPFAPESGWANSLERYYLTDENGQTKVICEVDVADSFTDFMNDAFPKAFVILKELSETN